MSKVPGRLPTVPEYYMEYIDNSTNLLDAPKQCCPFHKENTPSFSYNIEAGRWRCFGACHTGGDVVDMHMRYFKLESREKAMQSLKSIYQVAAPEKLEFKDLNKSIVVNQVNVDDKVTYEEALRLAVTPDRWVELDYAMSVYPIERWRISSLIAKWKGLV